MKAKEEYTYAIDQARAVVRQLQPAQMSLPTPDTEWDVEALLRHMLYEISWTPDIVVGQTIAEVGDRYDGDLLGADSQAAWHHAYVEAREAVRRCDPTAIAHLSYGDVKVRDYLEEAALDQLVHAWDLGEAIGVTVVFDAAIATTLYERTVPRQNELVASGLFAPAVQVPRTADVQTKLLALLGRSVSWRQKT